MGNYVRYWAFVYNYKHLCRIKRSRRGFLYVVITIGWCIHRCYCLYFTSDVHEVIILYVLGVDVGVFVCYHVDS